MKSEVIFEEPANKHRLLSLRVCNIHSAMSHVFGMGSNNPISSREEFLEKMGKVYDRIVNNSILKHGYLKLFLKSDQHQSLSLHCIKFESPHQFKKRKLKEKKWKQHEKKSDTIYKLYKDDVLYKKYQELLKEHYKENV